MDFFSGCTMDFFLDRPWFFQDRFGCFLNRPWIFSDLLNSPGFLRNFEKRGVEEPTLTVGPYCLDFRSFMAELQIPNHFHPLLQIFGMHCQTICLPFQLFLFLEELSNITYSSLLTLTVMQNLVRSNQLNVSHFVIQRQLLYCHCAAWKHHAAHLKAFYLSAYDLLK